jgi:hypothetical protein
MTKKAKRWIEFRIQINSDASKKFSLSPRESAGVRGKDTIEVVRNKK